MAKRQIEVVEINEILKRQGLNRRERRHWIKIIRKEVRMNEKEFIHPDPDGSDVQSSG